MIHTLEKLSALHEAHLHAAQALYARETAVLAAIDQERIDVDGELRLIGDQRAAWETQWQQWLREDGVLRRGQEYNLYHLTLSAWEEEVRERLDEVLERHRAAKEKVDAARAAMLRQQSRLDVLRRELATAKTRWRSQRIGRAESRAIDDLVFHGRTAQAAE